MSEWALDSRTLVHWFGCFVSLSSPRGILFVYWKILKISRHLQKFIWSFIHRHSKTISFNIKWLYRKEKKKLRIKVLPIGLEWSYKLSSIDVRSRLVIRLRDMTPSLNNIAWLKWVCSMFLIEKLKKKKVFVEVSLIVTLFCYHLYDLWTELTDSSLREALGFSIFFLRSGFVLKNFAFLDWVFIAVCRFSVL